MAIWNKKSRSEETLEKLYDQLDEQDPGSPEAMRIADTIESIEKANSYKPHLSPDAVFSGLASVGGILIIVLAEGKDIFMGATKAWSNVPRPKF